MDAKKELKVLSKDEQIAVAKDILKRYPKANKVIVAADGQAFIADESENAAKNHARNNAYGKELKLETFTRDELEAKVELKKAKEVIALVEAAETVEAVEALVAGDERATVKDAVVKRIETLKAA
ncbi:MAG: hypothetical protein EOM47_01145 [Bacteroidia bacterium]|nr:hypothetical protein [Bacteroidia bacterium]